MKRSRYNELVRHPERVNGGVAALFNGDLHLTCPSYAPREEWRVISRFIIEHVDEPNECTPEEIADLDRYISAVMTVMHHCTSVPGQ